MLKVVGLLMFLGLVSFVTTLIVLGLGYSFLTALLTNMGMGAILAVVLS